MNKDKIKSAVFEAIDELNLLLPKDQRLIKSVTVVLSGSSGELDSFGLVNLIVASEQKIEEKFSLAITLVDERAMSQKENPFKTVGTLIDYIYLLLSEKNTNGR